MCTDTLACEALTCTRCSRTLFPQDMDAGAEEAPRRAPNIAAALSCFALMSGTQLSHCAFVVVLVSLSRATSCVALSTCQRSLLAGALGMVYPQCRGGYPRHVVLRSPPREWNHGTRYCGTLPSSRITMYLGRRYPQVLKESRRG